MEKSPKAPSFTLLIADDEERLRSLLQQVLEKAGYRILLAADGCEVLRLLTETPRPIDVLITDLSMPGPCGRELLERVRTLLPNLRIICLSGHVQGAAVEDGVHYVPKPFTLAGLLKKVRQVLE